MTPRVLFLLLVLLLNIHLSVAQKKVKYKDLIVLLNAKQFDQAEPFLKKYLKDNTDNPNAYLFMGMIYQEKSLKEDVLKETELILNHSDSAITNFEVAYKTIDDREVRRNDEYYQAYNRRNVRTGEFGVQLSDVKLDIEKRMKSLKERKENVQKLKTYFVHAEKLYIASLNKFKEIKLNLPESKFYLLATEQTKKSLDDFVSLYDSVLQSFDSYKTTLKLVGKTGYNQSLVLMAIKSYENDGIATADFTKDEVKIWDFKAWALTAKDIITNDIELVREDLLQTDKQLNLLGEKLKKDSVSVSSLIQKAISSNTISKLKKYDANPLPAYIFALKASELNYASMVIENKALKNTEDLILKSTLTNKELKQAKQLDSLASLVSALDIEKEALNYPDFIARAYGDVLVVKKLVNSLKEFGSNEVTNKSKELDSRLSSLNWIVSKADSIPLFSRPSVIKNPNKMLLVDPEKFTVGLKFGADSLAQGYFHTITPSRVPDLSAFFNVDKVNFKKRNFSSLKASVANDGKGQVYFVLIFSEETNKDKYAVSIAKIYRLDGLAWAFNYSLDAKPSELAFVQATGELSLKMVSASGEPKTIVIDKNGKIVR